MACRAVYFNSIAFAISGESIPFYNRPEQCTKQRMIGFGPRPRRHPTGACRSWTCDVHAAMHCMRLVQSHQEVAGSALYRVVLCMSVLAVDAD